jgi:hypothetical protein
MNSSLGGRDYALEEDGDDVAIVDNPSFTDESPSDIHPNLDYNDEDDEHGKNAIDGNDAPGKEHGVQQEYIRAIQKRLQAELSKG